MAEDKGEWWISVKKATNSSSSKKVRPDTTISIWPRIIIGDVDRVFKDDPEDIAPCFLTIRRLEVRNPFLGVA